MNENLTEDELMKKALLLIQRLNYSGLDNESILARLEKQGIPEHITKEAYKDLFLDSKREIVNEAKFDLNMALLRIGLGIVAAIISMIILPGLVVIPIGLIAGGIIYAAIAKKKME